MNTLKVISFNMKHDSPFTLKQYQFENRKESIFHIIHTYQPDIIGTQELTFLTKQELENNLQEYQFIGLPRYETTKLMFNEFTDILIKKDRFIVLEDTTFWLSSKPEETATKLPLSVFPRICTMVKLQDKITNKKFYVFNTHLDHILDKNRYTQLQFMADKIMYFLSKESLPFIITGDLNTTAQSKTIQNLIQVSLNKNWNIHNAFHFIKPFNTMHYHLGKVNHDKAPIDHIFFSKEFEFVEGKIIIDHKNNIYPSDHFPVYIQIK